VGADPDTAAATGAPPRPLLRLVKPTDVRIGWPLNYRNISIFRAPRGERTSQVKQIVTGDTSGAHIDQPGAGEWEYRLRNDDSKPSPLFGPWGGPIRVLQNAKFKIVQSYPFRGSRTAASLHGGWGRNRNFFLNYFGSGTGSGADAGLDWFYVSTNTPPFRMGLISLSVLPDGQRIWNSGTVTLAVAGGDTLLEVSIARPAIDFRASRVTTAYSAHEVRGTWTTTTPLTVAAINKAYTDSETLELTLTLE